MSQDLLSADRTRGVQRGTELGCWEAAGKNWQRFRVGPVPHIFWSQDLLSADRPGPLRGVQWGTELGCWEVARKNGSASAWARFLIFFRQCGHRQAWLVSLEWELPEAGAILFSPSFKDAMPIWMDDRHSCLGEHNLAAEVGKGVQADEGMGEGGHHMSLHRCRWEGWDRSKGCASDRPLREAVCHLDFDGGSHGIEIGHGCGGREVNSTGARVGDASVG